MNDAAAPHGTTDSPPIGVEVQVTAFAFNQPDVLGNTTFYRYRLVYRGLHPLEDAWFGLWVDSDLGGGLDDRVGSAPELEMG